MSAHPEKALPKIRFLGKTLKAPVWISSMTGGTRLAGKINHNLARAAAEFGFGMGLGSCRILMDDESHLPDFDLRHIIGDEQPFFANLGIAQIEKLLADGNIQAAVDLNNLLKTDGIIIHVNPMQEWLQPEGDRLKHPPIEIIREFVHQVDFRVVVKEVGQGFGPQTIEELMKLPVSAMEFAAFGGTNFARVELMRNLETNKELYEPLSYVGHTAEDMVNSVNATVAGNPGLHEKELIISGGLKSFLDGYYLIEKSKLPAIYGMASTFLKYAKEDYQQLKEFTQNQIKGLKMAYAYLTVR